MNYVFQCVVEGRDNKNKGRIKCNDKMAKEYLTFQDWHRYTPRLYNLTNDTLSHNLTIFTLPITLWSLIAWLSRMGLSKTSTTSLYFARSLSQCIECQGIGGGDQSLCIGQPNSSKLILRIHFHAFVNAKLLNSFVSI